MAHSSYDATIGVIIVRQTVDEEGAVVDAEVTVRLQEAEASTQAPATRLNGSVCPTGEGRWAEHCCTGVCGRGSIMCMESGIFSENIPIRENCERKLNTFLVPGNL